MSKFCDYQFYRVEPGDVDIPDQPCLDPDLPTAVQTLGERLIALHSDDRVSRETRPHHGRLRLSNGSTHAEVMVIVDPKGRLLIGVDPTFVL